VTSIGVAPFKNCASLQFNEYNNAYYLGNSKNPYIILVKAQNTNISSCEVNTGTRFIHCEAFLGCDKLSDITIANGVTSIGTNAFVDCTNLYEITIPDSVRSIGNAVFFNCNRLTSVTFENPNGWVGIDSKGKVVPSKLDIPSIAAKYLTDTYVSCSWTRDRE